MARALVSLVSSIVVVIVYSVMTIYVENMYVLGVISILTALVIILMPWEDATVELSIKKSKAYSDLAKLNIILRNNMLLVNRLEMKLEDCEERIEG